MKPEKMQEIIDKKANGYEDIQPKGSDNFFKGLHVFIKLIIAVIILAFLVVGIIEIFLLMPTITTFTGTNKDKFLSELEDKYHRKFEIVEDNTVSRRGTGTYIIKTTKQPIIEFNAEKDLQGNYRTDFEERIMKIQNIRNFLKILNWNLNFMKVQITKVFIY